jgi:hypothetical protein
MFDCSVGLLLLHVLHTVFAADPPEPGRERERARRLSLLHPQKHASAMTLFGDRD